MKIEGQSTGSLSGEGTIFALTVRLNLARRNYSEGDLEIYILEKGLELEKQINSLGTFRQSVKTDKAFFTPAGEYVRYTYNGKNWVGQLCENHESNSKIKNNCQGETAEIMLRRLLTSKTEKVI